MAVQKLTDVEEDGDTPSDREIGEAYWDHLWNADAQDEDEDDES